MVTRDNFYLRVGVNVEFGFVGVRVVFKKYMFSKKRYSPCIFYNTENFTAIQHAEAFIDRQLIKMIGVRPVLKLEI